MIPKTIHFCWLSNDPYPKDIQRYMDTWKKKLPDYTIVKWDFTRFPKDKSHWVSEAFDAKKYAFASDYIRNYALYTEGGIYLDADIEVLESFDSLLNQPYFLGFENGTGCIDAGIMAAEKGNEMFKVLLDYYDSHHFVNEDGSLNVEPLPMLMKRLHSGRYVYREIDSPKDFKDTDGVLSVLAYDYFSPINLETREYQGTDRTMAVHRFAASWSKGWPKYRRIIKKILGGKITAVIIKTKRKLLGKKS